MKISKICIQGFRAFKDLTEISLGAFTTIVGKNDSGKSSILHALDIFFNGSPDEGDFNRDQDAEDPIVIQVSFTDLPASIQLEEGVDANLKAENLLDPQHNLSIKKTCGRKNPKKPKITYIIEDFSDPEYQNLCSLREAELNEKGKSLELDFKKAGRGVTSRGKREALRKIATEKHISIGLVEIEPTEAAIKVLDILLDFSLFRADESLNEEGTPFQKEFKAIVFLDGPTDCDFFNTFAETLYRNKKLISTFEGKQIGILPGGGNNLKHWITRKAIKSINRKYCVIFDSDLKSPRDHISEEKKKLRSEIEKDGGVCFILKKREIENYLHPTVIKEKTGKEVEIDDFTDVKSLFDDKICGLAKYMTAEQILTKDKYDDNGKERHELLEMFEIIMGMVE